MDQITKPGRVLEAYKRPISVTLRTRLRGEVYSREGQLERVFYSLNEFIVNRGISGVLSTLEVRTGRQVFETMLGLLRPLFFISSLF